MTVLYQSEICTIFNQSGQGYLGLTWHRYATSVQFRQVAEEALQALQTQAVGKLLADHTHMKMLGAADQQWMRENWLPRACQAGLSACAIIRSLDYFTRLSTRNVFAQLDGLALTTRFFDAEADARAWLRTLQGH